MPVSRFYFLVLAICNCVTITFSYASNRRPPEAHLLPHCTRNGIMEGEIHENVGVDGSFNVSSSTQLLMGLNEIACLELKANKSYGENSSLSYSLMHTVEYLRLEHHYPISGKYTFGVPSVGLTCKCDCYGGERICTASNDMYKNCTAGAVCYRIFKGFQPNIGCVTSELASACCQVRIDPYRDWTFEALRLKQPDTVLVLRYRIFERLAPTWRKIVDDVVEMPLNRGVSRFELNNEHLIEITAGGIRPNRQVEPGMYFRQIGVGTDNEPLRGGVDLNGLSETSLNKLGWFRMDKGQWGIRKGLPMITEAQHVSVVDCKAQRYTSTLNAEQYVLKSDDEDILNYNLGAPLVDEAWVSAVDVGSRVVRVEHSEGSLLMLTVRTSSRPRIVHHISHFSDFNGTIEVDKSSHRYLNITVNDARGTLIGKVFPTESRSTAELVFSVETGDNMRPQYRAIISTPEKISSRRMVCIHPNNDLASEQCRWLPFVDAPLEEQRIVSRWQTGHTDCPGCNERGLQSFIDSLDPRRWVDGLNSPTEFFACAVEVALAVGAILLVILVFTRCILPMCSCLCSIVKPPKRK